MTRMIEQILDFARIRAGRSFALELESANVHEICQSVVDELRLSRPDRQIVLDVAGQGDVICDADRIAQVLSNLIGNAIQHEISGPIHVVVRDAPGDAVAIDVHNFGPAISEHAQANIFDAFWRGSTGEEHGASVDCAFIANEIMHAHGRVDRGTLTRSRWDYV